MTASEIAGWILVLFGFVCIGTLIEMITEAMIAKRAKREWEEHQRRIKNG